MELETVLQRINDLVLTKTGRQLKDVEKLVIRGAWEAKTYSQIADNCKYSLGYIKQAAAPRLWKLLSGILEKDISKTNFRVVMESQGNEPADNLALASEGIQATQTINRSLDFSNIPKINTCYGRKKELALLDRWLIKDRCRLIGIVGMGGIGKTTLAVSCVEEVRNEFELIIWRDLRNTTSVTELIVELIELISPQGDRNYTEDIDSAIAILLDRLRQHRCLIVFDTTTTMKQTDCLEGNYPAEDRHYGKLLKRLGEELHQSCAIFIAREKPREIAILNGEERPVRSLTLQGLGSEAKEILKDKKLLDPERWEEIIQIYRGNPLALKIIANTIGELFGSKVSAFLRQNTIIFGELNDLLDEQFECLSTLETEIIYWLAIKEFPLSLSKLSSALIFISSQAKLLEALESLLRRSFISKYLDEEEIMFSLPQPIVRQYITERICERICQEIQKVSQSKKVEQLGLLRTIALTENSSLPSDRKNQKQQNSVIIQLIINQLCRIIRDESLVEEKLNTILSLLSGKTLLVVGYARNNLQNLLRGLELGFERSSDLISL